MEQSIFEQVHGRLIVSCQAEEGSPFNSPEGVCAFAECAVTGGAAAIRSCGVEKTEYIINHIQLPVIGLTLPLISYGGSSVVTIFAMLGLVSGAHARPQSLSHERYVQPFRG